MASDSANFQIFFKTFADNTGITAIGQGITRLNTQLSEVSRVANQALGLLGLSLGLEKLNEFGNKAFEAQEKAAAFKDAITGATGGSRDLFNQLNALNLELEHTTGTSYLVSQSIQQLFARAGVEGSKLGALTKGVIEFAASSAGTVEPISLAAIVAKRLGGAADATDLSLSRLGITAKDVDGVIQQFNIRGGTTAEAMVKAGGGLKEFDLEVDHAGRSLGTFVNLFRVPFIDSFNDALVSARQKLDGVNDSSSKLGQNLFTAISIAADSITHVYSRGSLLFQEILAESQVVGGKIAQFILGVVSSVVEGATALVSDAIGLIDKLAQHAADVARDLSHGLIDIKIDPAADQAAQKSITDLGASVISKLKGISDGIGQTIDGSFKKVGNIAQQIAGDKDPPLIAALFGDQKALDRIKKRYQEIFNFFGPDKKSGSQVTKPPGADASGADAEKAATDALTNAKYRLSAAQQTYEAEVEKTKALEEGGNISVEQADARRGAAARDYLAQLEQG